MLHEILYVLWEIARDTWLAIKPDLTSLDFFDLDFLQWVQAYITSNALYDSLLWGVIFIHTLWMLWYWGNLSIFETDFKWPDNAPQKIWLKAKETWDILDCREPKMRYEIPVASLKPNHPYVKLNGMVA